MGIMSSTSVAVEKKNNIQSIRSYQLVVDYYYYTSM